MPASICSAARLAAAVGIVCVVALGGVATAQETPAPQDYGRDDQGYAAQFADVLVLLDTFWQEAFAGWGIAYDSPAVVPLDGPVVTGCGPAGPDDFAFYCPADLAIYYAPAALADHERRIGDFAPIVVIAHEWGHHVQRLAGVAPAPGNAFELQADCLAGVYASEAGRRGLLDPGDVTEAVASSASAGDPLGLPQDAPGAHGINDDRVIAFMRGYLDGVEGCGLPSRSSPAPLPPPPGEDDGSAPDPAAVAPPGTAPSLWTLVPSALNLPQGQSFRVESEGTSSFEEVATALTQFARPEERLGEWGWEENVFRAYASDDPPAGAAGYVVLGVHRFATADGAAAALPAFAAARRDALGYAPVDLGLIADQTEAMAGRAINGDEVVVYARRGNLVFRAAAVAPDGDPTDDAIAALLVPLTPLADQPRLVSPALSDALPRAGALLPGLELAEEHARSAATIASTFPDAAGAERHFRDWGWRESASRVFTGRTPSGTTRVEVSVFRLADERAADEALPYFLGARAETLGLTERTAPPARADAARMIVGPVGDEYEATVYLRRGRDLFRITTIGEGNPEVDIARLLG